MDSKGKEMREIEMHAVKPTKNQQFFLNMKRFDPSVF